MSEHEIQTQITENAKGLSPEKKVRFMLVCSIRVLPFIGITGDFNLWEKNNNTSVFLYTMFSAIDFIANYGKNGPILGRIIVDAAKAAFLVTTNNDVSPVIKIIMNAVTVAHYYERSKDTTNAADKDTTNAAADTAYNNALEAYTSYVKSVYNTHINVINNSKSFINNIIRDDISHIEGEHFNRLNSDIGLYGDVWHNFQNALKTVDCEYWGKLYTNIFRTGFEGIRTTLDKRLKVPKKIKKLGAKAVAEYLLKEESKEREKQAEENGAWKIPPISSDCTKLQTLISSLISTLREKKESDIDSDIIEELQDIVSYLEKAKSIRSKDTAKKNGLLGKLKNLLKNLIEELGNERSKKYRAIKGLKNGTDLLNSLLLLCNIIIKFLSQT